MRLAAQHVWTPTWRTVDRLRDDHPLTRDEPFSWVVTVLITLLAFCIRLPRLAMPPKIVFDETYYAKEAWSILHFGYAKAWPENANDLINAGTVNVWLDRADSPVHPQMAKYLIAIGEWMFGMNSFGWRFMALVCGCLMIAGVVRLGRRLSRSTLIGAMAGFLLCVDGLTFVMSRIALLDIFQAMFTVMAVACVAADRDWFRRRLANYLTRHKLTNLNGTFGPLQLWRPWRLAAGLMFGLACGCKWNSVYVLAVMGVISIVFDWRARRTAGARGKAWLSLLWDAPWAFFMMVVLAIITYTATWAGWLLSADAHNRNWAFLHPDSQSTQILNRLFGDWLGDALASLWNYHVWIWSFHTGDWITEQTHPYDAYPAGWPVVARTIGVEYTGGIPPGTPGCPADSETTCEQIWRTTTSTGEIEQVQWLQSPGTPGCPEGTHGDCMTVITGLGTPFLWWMAAVALVAGLIFWIFGRDWRFAVPVLAGGATWIGWFPNADRPVFFFYAIMLIPFTVIILAMCMGKILGPPGHPRRRNRAMIVGFACVVIALNFAFIYPILSDSTMPIWAWQLRMWFGGWI